MIGNKLYDSIVRTIAKELKIPEEVVHVAYKSYWEFASDIFSKVDIDLSEQELANQKLSINIPGIGKFYTSFEKIQNVNKKINIIRENKKHENKKTNY